MLAEVSTLAKLDDLDAQMHRLQSRLAELPRLAAAEKKGFQDRKTHLAARRVRMQAIDTERKQLEADVQLHQDKRARLARQIDQASTEGQLQAFHHEIDYLHTEVAKAEDRIIAMMEELEAMEQALDAESAEVDFAEQRALEFLKEAEKEYREGGERVIAIATGRRKYLDELPPAYTVLYEKLRKKYKTGPLVTEVSGPHCSVCQMALRPAFWQKVKTERDALHLCEECGRVLHYNPPN